MKLSLLDRMTQLRGLTVALASGSEPKVQPEIDSIDDCTEVYGDNVIEIYPDESDLCFHPRNPTGQHVYGMKGFDRHCIYCGRRTG